MKFRGEKGKKNTMHQVILNITSHMYVVFSEVIFKSKYMYIIVKHEPDYKDSDMNCSNKELQERRHCYTKS